MSVRERTTTRASDPLPMGHSQRKAVLAVLRPALLVLPAWILLSALPACRAPRPCPPQRWVCSPPPAGPSTMLQLVDTARAVICGDGMLVHVLLVGVDECGLIDFSEGDGAEFTFRQVGRDLTVCYSGLDPPTVRMEQATLGEPMDEARLLDSPALVRVLRRTREARTHVLAVQPARGVLANPYVSCFGPSDPDYEGGGYLIDAYLGTVYEAIMPPLPFDQLRFGEPRTVDHE